MNIEQYKTKQNSPQVNMGMEKYHNSMHHQKMKCNIINKHKM